MTYFGSPAKQFARHQTIESGEAIVRTRQGASSFWRCGPCVGMVHLFIDAGHILGSASIFLELEEQSHSTSVLFFGRPGQRRSRPIDLR
jgi:hypothetical protein